MADRRLLNGRSGFGLSRRLRATGCGVLAATAALPILLAAQRAFGATTQPAISADVFTAPTMTISANITWLLACGFLVLLMQLGFAMVETGLCRAKNAGHTFAMNLMLFPLASIAFWIYGFALGFGNYYGPGAATGLSSLGSGMALLHNGFAFDAGGHLWNLLGTSGFFLTSSKDVSVLAFFFFNMVVFDVAAVIPLGGMSERWSWANFVLYGCWAALPYAIVVAFTWGGGWLAQLGVNLGWGHGYVDFAGSGIVHVLGGAMALAGSMVLGPRIGKFHNGRPQALPGHHLPMVMGGTFILAVGWLGYTPGFTLAGTDTRVAMIAVNTVLAASTAAVASMALMWFKFGKPDPTMLCNGLLAGLVAISGPAAFVNPIPAAIIGAAAGILVVYSVFFFDRLGIDDPVGAISVHGACVLGVLSVGVLANGDYGVGYNGVLSSGVSASPAQFGVQLLGLVVIGIVGFGLAYILFALTNRFVPIRVPRDVELQGLDIPEMGAHGYPDFELKTTHSVSEVLYSSQRR